MNLVLLLGFTVALFTVVGGAVDCYRPRNRGLFYRGNVSVTTDGLPCRKWKLEEENRTAAYYPNAGLDDGEHNYCRNPSDEGEAWLEKPWCFYKNSSTGLIEKGFCSVPLCEDRDCYSFLDKGESYNGTVASVSGEDCEDWDKGGVKDFLAVSSLAAYDSFLHLLQRDDPDDDNYCRNPLSGVPGYQFFQPWCAIKKSRKYSAEACTTIPECNEYPTVISCNNSKPCHFPFVYEEITFTECTDFQYSEKWCATDVNATTKEMQEWSFCSPCHSDLSVLPTVLPTSKGPSFSGTPLVGDSSGVSAGIIAVAVIIPLLVICVVLVVTMYWWRRKRGKTTFSPSRELPPIDSDDTLKHQPGGITLERVYASIHTSGPKTGADGYLAPVEVLPHEDSHEKTGSRYQSLLKSEKPEEIYWKPAVTVRDLFSQIEGKKFRRIPREHVKTENELGRGAFGKVEKGMWKTCDEEIVVAVKTLASSEPGDRVKFLQEAAIMGQFRHKNVVKLHGVVLEGEPLQIVLEYLKGGNLKDYLKSLVPQNGKSPHSAASPQNLLRMAQEVACGMNYLSEKSFVHRDLAARNILLDSDHACKIADFGLSRDVDSDTYYRMKETGRIPIRWTAPEAISYHKYSTSSDVWSYGILLYELWSLGAMPYKGKSNREVVTLTTDAGYRLPSPPGCSRAIYQLMIDCWHSDHHQRPSFADIVSRLGVDAGDILVNEDGTDLGKNIGALVDANQHFYLDLQHQYIPVV